MRQVLFRAAILVVLLFAAIACAAGYNDGAGYEPRPSTQPRNVFVYHDDSRNVTCWLAYESISCLSDRVFGP